MRLPTHLPLVALGLVLLPSPAPAEPLALDMNQALERALAVDPRITEKERYVDYARAQLREARGAGGWAVDLNTFLGLAPTVKGGIFESTDPATGRRVIDVSADAFDINGLSPWYYLDFKVIKPLHTFGKIEHYSKAAAGNIQVQRGEVERVRGDILLDVGRAYYGYLAAQDTQNLLADTLKKAKSARDLIQGWLDRGEGEVKQSDLFAVQTAIALIQRYQAEAEGYRRIALDGLRTLVGAPPGSPISVNEPRLRPLPLPEGSLAELKARAMTNRPEVRQLAAGLEARREFVMARRSESLPNVYAGVGGVVSYASRRQVFQQLGIYDPFYSAGMTPMIGLKWDWAGGRQSAQVAQAKAQLEATLALQDQARVGIPYQVAEQYHTVHAHYDMVQRLYEGSRAGRRWLISAYADFEAGVEGADKLVTAFQGYIAAYSDYLKVVNDYNLHVLRLRVVTGDI